MQQHARSMEIPFKSVVILKGKTHEGSRGAILPAFHKNGEICRPRADTNEIANSLLAETRRNSQQFFSRRLGGPRRHRETSKTERNCSGGRFLSLSASGAAPDQPRAQALGLGFGHFGSFPWDRRAPARLFFCAANSCKSWVQKNDSKQHVARQRFL